MVRAGWIEPLSRALYARLICFLFVGFLVPFLVRERPSSASVSSPRAAAGYLICLLLFCSSLLRLRLLPPLVSLLQWLSLRSLRLYIDSRRRWRGRFERMEQERTLFGSQGGGKGRSWFFYTILYYWSTVRARACVASFVFLFLKYWFRFSFYVLIAFVRLMCMPRA